MTLITEADRVTFAEQGYLVRSGLLTPSQIAAAQDALWSGIEADRADPSSWFDAGPPEPVSRHHPAIRATLHESPVFAMAQALIVDGALSADVSPAPHLVYPRGDRQWKMPRTGHLDGFPAPGNPVPLDALWTWPICLTIYVDDVESHGGAFTVWPGSHRAAAEYFRTHERHTLERGIANGRFPIGEPREVTGTAGTVCFWHGNLVHAGSWNASSRIRMALIARIPYAHRGT
jgi:hypothetical protein